MHSPITQRRENYRSVVVGALGYTFAYRRAARADPVERIGEVKREKSRMRAPAP